MGPFRKFDGTTLPFLFIAGYVIFETRAMHVGSFSDPGPGLFPLLLAVLLVVSSFVAMVRSGSERVSGSSEPGCVAHVLYAVGILVLFRAALPLAGYPLSALLIFFLLLKVVGDLNWLRTVVYSVLFTAGSYLLFAQALAIRFPKGVLGF